MLLRSNCVWLKVPYSVFASNKTIAIIVVTHILIKWIASFVIELRLRAISIAVYKIDQSNQKLKISLSVKLCRKSLLAVLIIIHVKQSCIGWIRIFIVSDSCFLSFIAIQYTTIVDQIEIKCIS